MERFEMAEKLMEKAGIDYGAAKRALEANDWDVERAVACLRRGGKDGGRKESREQEARVRRVKGGLAKAVDWLTQAVQRGSRNFLSVSRDGKHVFDISLTAAALLLLLTHGFFLLAALVGLLMGYRCRFISEKEDKAFREDVRQADDVAEEINQRHTVNSFGEGGSI